MPKPPNSTKAGRGGARAGAGRKRSDISDIRAQLGPVPVGKPLKLVRWYADLIALLTDAQLAGRPVKKHLEMVRASSGASARLLPPDIIYEAQKRLDRDERELKESAGGGAVTTRKEDDVAQRARAVRRDPA